RAAGILLPPTARPLPDAEGGDGQGSRPASLPVMPLGYSVALGGGVPSWDERWRLLPPTGGLWNQLTKGMGPDRAASGAARLGLVCPCPRPLHPSPPSSE